MKNLIVYLLLLLSISPVLKAQQGNSSAKADSIVFSFYDPYDDIGLTVFQQLNFYENYGHLGGIYGGTNNQTYLKEFITLFEPSATLPDDLSETTIKSSSITIAQYGALAKNKGFQPYVLFIEREDPIIARKKNESDYFHTQIRVFKLFNSKAIIGANQKRGVIYTVELRLNSDASDVKITNISFEPEDEFFDFLLGKYGRENNSSILITNNLKSLIVEAPKSYEPKTVPTKSNIFVYAGYASTSFLQPEAMRNNINDDYTWNGNEHGSYLGIQFQKAFAPKDIFGILLGVEYERNMYNLDHTNANFIYTQNQNGNALLDAEGKPYDRKHVNVASYEEQGLLTYLKPEVGLFFNIGGKHINFQIMGSVGSAWLLSSSYQASSTVSYQGEITGLGNPISQDALGFYTDLLTDFEGDHTRAQNYFFYKAGAGVDFIIGDHFGISLLCLYRSAFTNALEDNKNEMMFLDPHSGAGFESQLNNLSKPRVYNALSLQAGVKFYLNGKR